jgi:hypothetical protein
MARPRKPAAILAFTGAFKKDPQREREDLDGVGKFDTTPPQDLPQPLVPYWRKVVRQINPIVLTASDVSSVETMARLLAQFELTSDKSIATELRQWFSQYGMTAVGRTKLAPPRKKGGGNAFADT